jgi:hypothetical protein
MSQPPKLYIYVWDAPLLDQLVLAKLKQLKICLQLSLKPFTSSTAQIKWIIRAWLVFSKV